jgi:hypothetical protein
MREKQDRQRQMNAAGVSLWARYTGLGLLALLGPLGLLGPGGCSSGGYSEGGPMDLPAADGAMPRDGGLTDGAAADLSSGDMAVVPNSWTFFGSSFVGRPPSCFAVMNWWAVTTSVDTPYYCSIDVFFQSRPTRDAVYKMTSKSAMVLGPNDANVIITDKRTGGVEQWHPLDSGQVSVRVTGTMLTITLENALLHGAVSVPAGTPDQEVNGTFLCP